MSPFSFPSFAAIDARVDAYAAHPQCIHKSFEIYVRIVGENNLRVHCRDTVTGEKFCLSNVELPRCHPVHPLHRAQAR